MVPSFRSLKIKRRLGMDEDSRKARRTTFAWVIGANVAAWGLYFVLTKVVGIDFDMIRQANYG